MSHGLPLSQDESRILQLHDQLQSLRLQIAILNAQRKTTHPQPPTNDSISGTSVSQQMQHEMLSARAQLKLREDAIQAVLTANPILQAVHNGTNASPVERDLLPLVQRRDQAAKSLAKHSLDIGALDNDLILAQVELTRTTRANVKSAAALYELLDSQRRDGDSAHIPSAAQHEILRLEAHMRSSRHRWRLIKGVASSVIVGSGVDWTHNDKLRGMVLDVDDDDHD
ncbi:hypothetical protein CDD81_2952 [Ophiocordyceps australis]|uniref:Centromere protein H C-terminal domain-containing protein n=1 Tax=Ophiocordyceps australis TaxID=1399860 RepID=A0A2C5YHT3_9HYPO|nr:hypothetical protein CDD81_2952 [Ophiocordyceps australis]